jgi:hypothetical protein
VKRVPLRSKTRPIAVCTTVLRMRQSDVRRTAAHSCNCHRLALASIRPPRDEDLVHPVLRHTWVMCRVRAKALSLLQHWNDASVLPICVRWQHANYKDANHTDNGSDK